MTKRAFTLIELLVVIAIIGILSAVVLVGMQEAQARARYVQIVSQMREVIKAMEMHYAEYGVYPNDSVTGAKPVTDAITQWPSIPCSGWAYDWNGSSNPVFANREHLAINKPNGSGGWTGVPQSLYFVEATTTWSDIRNRATKKITCAE